MQPAEFTENDYTGLAKKWYDAAVDNANTTARINLYTLTKNAISSLENLNSIDPKNAKKFANLILQSFDKHAKGNDAESLWLAQWLAKNTLPSGQGALSELDHLFQTIAKINLLDLKTSDTLISLNNIEAQAENYIGQIKKNFPVGVFNSVRDPIIKNYVQSQSYADSRALKITSKQLQEEVPSIPHGSLQKQNIKTADHAIEHVKKYGQDLTFIDISRIKFTPEQLREFIKYVPNLTTFIGISCQFTQEHVKELVALKNLTILNLSNNKIGPEGTKIIAASFPNLTSLDLMYNNIKEEGGFALAALTKLTILNLSNNGIGPKAVEKLAGTLKDLTSLNLSYNNIEDVGMTPIGTLTNLTKLYLNGNSIGNEGLKSVTPLKNLAILSLSNNKIGPEGIGAVDDLENLLELFLNHNNLGDEGIHRANKLTKLTVLELANNGITSQGTEELVIFTNLKVLNLNENKIEDVEKLVALLPVMTKLSRLDVSKNPIRDEGIEAIEKALELRPNLHVKLPEIAEEIEL